MHHPFPFLTRIKRSSSFLKSLTAAGFLCIISHKVTATEFIREKKQIKESLSIHINGISYHFASDRSTLNEENMGLGYSYYLGKLDSKSKILNNIRISTEAEFYSDSFSDFGYLFGATFQKKLNAHLDYGVNIGLIHEDNLKEKSGLYLHPYLFPYLETTFDTKINTRFTYIPPVQTKGIFSLQLITRF